MGDFVSKIIVGPVLKDKRGTVAIQVALILPILIIIVVGAFEVWKILYVKQTLNDAVYQGVRLLAMRPNHPGIAREAEALVRRSASRNQFVGDEALTTIPPLFEVLVNDGGGKCFSGDPYEPLKPGSVSITVTYRWTLGKGLVGWAFPEGSFLGFMQLPDLKMSASAGGPVLCERTTPTPQPAGGNGPE